MDIFCGLDFGTSNSVVSVLNCQVPQTRSVIREPSVLYFPKQGICDSTHFVGNEAIKQYLRHNMEGRFIQSLKTLLSDEEFKPTLINKRPYRPDDLVALIISDLKVKAEKIIKKQIHTVVLGRPVYFSDIPKCDALAERRLKNAARMAGFRNVSFQYEPVAAAYAYKTKISNKRTVFVADVGGGTTDFTVMTLDPTQEKFSNHRDDILATDGIHVGGDEFDTAIMWNRVIHHFGFRSYYESWGKSLEVPVYIYRTLCKWDRIAFLKTMTLREELHYILSGSAEKRKIKQLITLIDKNLGYLLFQSIENSKIALTEWDAAGLDFQKAGISIQERITEKNFSNYIMEMLLNISRTIQRVIKKAKLSEDDIDDVFLTGGSSRVRSLVRLFQYKFGAVKIQFDDDAFTNVATGLALYQLQDFD